MDSHVLVYLAVGLQQLRVSRMDHYIRALTPENLLVCDKEWLKPACLATEISLDNENVPVQKVYSTMTKALIRLRGCTGWSAPLFFTCYKDVFSRRGLYYRID